MDTVYITWEENVIRFSNIKDSTNSKLDGKGFYAILGAIYNAEKNSWGNIKLLYLGQAFGQTLRERVQQEHPYPLKEECPCSKA